MHSSPFTKFRDPDALAQALAEPSRRAILENLRLGQKSVGELVTATALKQPNVSNHLARMRDQGIVRAERLGRHVYYSIALPVAELLLRLHETTADPLSSEAIESPSGAESVSPLISPGLVRTDATPTLEAWRQAFFRSILAGHEDRANALVNDMLAHRIDLEAIYFHVFAWAINHVGDLYMQGVTDEAHEHLASAITERMMGRVAQFYTPVARKSYRALFGGVAGNWHTLGLRMLSDGLRAQGWDTLFLGANVPTASFLAMAKTMRPDLVVVACALEEQLEELKLLLHQLHTARQELEGLHYRIVAGGYFLNSSPHVVSQLPIDFSSLTMHDFLTTVNHLYPVTDPSQKNPD